MGENEEQVFVLCDVQHCINLVLTADFQQLLYGRQNSQGGFYALSRTTFNKYFHRYKLIVVYVSIWIKVIQFNKRQQ